MEELYRAECCRSIRWINHPRTHTYALQSRVTVAAGNWAGNFSTLPSLAAILGGTCGYHHEQYKHYWQLLIILKVLLTCTIETSRRQRKRNSIYLTGGVTASIGGRGGGLGATGAD